MQIYLRPIEEADGKLIVKWRNSPDVLKHCFNQNPITEEGNLAFYKYFVETGRYVQFIVERADEEYGAMSYPIATVYLKDIDRTNKRCELCFFTSNDEEWNNESQSQAIRLLLEKAFKEFNMHKVYSFVFTMFDNQITLLEKAGFRCESVLRREAVASNGEYMDVYRMVVFEDEFK